MRGEVWNMWGESVFGLKMVCRTRNDILIGEAAMRIWQNEARIATTRVEEEKKRAKFKDFALFNEPLAKAGLSGR